jgi:hypothetical protein
VLKPLTQAASKLALALLLLASGAGLLSGLWYGYRLLHRPLRTSTARSLFEGVTYQRQVRNQPRALIFHVVTVDLTAPGIGFLVSPSAPNGQSIKGEPLQNSADTVPGFLQRHRLQVAINGSFFFPHYVHSPLSYYPHVGDGASTMGVSISNGDRYSNAEEGWAALCVIHNRDIRITEQDCPTNTQQGIAGDIQFVKDGQLYQDGLVILPDNDIKQMPRSAIAINKDTSKLWMVVVDGRQPGYSEGVTLPELGDFLIELGADRALNLDGGGSSTLAVDQQGQAALLNAPFQARIPMNLRPVANHFGLYAQPLSADSKSPDSKTTYSKNGISKKQPNDAS